MNKSDQVMCAALVVEAGLLLLRGISMGDWKTGFWMGRSSKGRGVVLKDWSFEAEELESKDCCTNDLILDSKNLAMASSIYVPRTLFQLIVFFRSSSAFALSHITWHLRCLCTEYCISFLSLF